SATRGPHVSPSNGAPPPPDPFAGKLYNQQYFQQRWGARIRPDELDYYLEDGLLNLQPAVLYPRELTISPLIAHVNSEDERIMQANRLISTRARHVETLLGENLRLRIRLDEMEQQTLWSTGVPPAPAAPTAPLPLTWAQRRLSLGFFEVRAWMAALYLE